MKHTTRYYDQYETIDELKDYIRDWVLFEDDIRDCDISSNYRFMEGNGQLDLIDIDYFEFEEMVHEVLAGGEI